MSRRVYVVGTDTGVGKTALTCALLHHAIASGTKAVPFKPAQSGTDDAPTDAARLLRAAGLDRALEPVACPLSYGRPLAPGVAANRSAFLRPTPASPDSSALPLDRVAGALDHWEARTTPDLTLIEGAGGLHVPMPGGTWQPAWIERLAHAAIVVGRIDLGTINHTLLTLDAVARLRTHVLGFYLVQTRPSLDPSAADNPPILAAARKTPYLGLLPFTPTPDTAGPPDLFSSLARVLG